MNLIRSIQVIAAALAVGLTLTAVAQAGSNGAVQRAETIRSQAMNDRYNLDALNALRIRSDALNRRYHLGSYAVVRQSSSGFDWVDASVGGAAVFGLFVIGGGVAVGMRRSRSERLTPA